MMCRNHKRKSKMQGKYTKRLYQTTAWCSRLFIMADKKIKQNYIISINLDTNLITLAACPVTKDPRNDNKILTSTFRQMQII